MKPLPADPTNTDPPPTCAEGCRYMQKFTGFSLQKNALRMEMASMIEPVRCGWNIKPGAIGGSPLDYAPCIFAHQAKAKG